MTLLDGGRIWLGRSRKQRNPWSRTLRERRARRSSVCHEYWILSAIRVLLERRHRRWDHSLRTLSPPNARSNSSPAALWLSCNVGWACLSSTSLSMILAGRAWPWIATEGAALALLSGSRIFSLRSSHPGATRLFSARSCSFKLCSQSLITFSASSWVFRIWSCKAWHDLMISSGDAAWPELDTTYFSRSTPLESAVEDGGNVEGSGL